MIRWLLAVVLLLTSVSVEAAQITRPTKTFGGTSFIDGVVPDASDFNGDANTVYADYNGNITDYNVASGAAIAGSKIAPAFVANVTINLSAPCMGLIDSSQGADGKRTDWCLSSGNLQLLTKSDAGVTQNTWLTVNRATGAMVVGGATTFSGAVTFNAGTNITLTGTVSMWAGSSAPSGWLLCDGTAYTATTYANSGGTALFDVLIPNVAAWGYPAAISTFTTLNGSTTVTTAVNHGRSVNDVVHVSTTGALNTIAAATKYYVASVPTANTMTLATTQGGSAISFTGAGTGTHSIYNTFKVPNTLGRVAVGTGSGSGLTARAVGGSGGAETISTAAMPSHSHTVNITDPGHSHSVLGCASGGGCGTGSSAYPQETGNSNNDVNSGTSSSTTGISASTNTTGSGAVDGNMQPFIAFTYIIKS